MISRNERAAAAALWLWAAAPLTASAAAAPSGAEQARTLFKSARHAYDLGRFEDALRDYSAAYDAKPTPSILFNIAQCHRKLEHLDQAAFFFQRFLDLDPTSKTAPTARALLEDLKGRIAARDAEKAEAARAEAARAEVARMEAARAEAERAEAARVQLAPVPHPAATPSAVGALTAPAEPAPTPIYSRWYVWAGVGVAVVAAGTVTYFLATSPKPRDGSLGSFDTR